VYDNYSTAELVSKMGEKKANTDPFRIFLLGIFGGAFVALGYVGYMIVTQSMASNIDVGMSKFIGAAVFPVGIMLCVAVGGSLFTGNNLISLAVLQGKATKTKLLRNWGLVWTGNLVGGVTIALLAFIGGIYKAEAVANVALNAAEHKLHLGFFEAIASAFLCNIVVSVSVWASLAGKDLVSKLFMLWFPIMLFALSGYQHVVANMYVFSISKLLGGDFTILSVFTKNLIPVTIGNALSGGIVIPLMYWTIFLKKATEEKNAIENK